MLNQWPTLPLRLGRCAEILEVTTQVWQSEPLGHLSDLCCYRVGLSLGHLHTETALSFA